MAKIKSETLDDEGTTAFTLEGHRHTIPNLLRARLWEQAGVDLAAYEKKHPYVGDARVIVRAKDAEKALKGAVSAAQKQAKDFKAAFNKEF